MNTEVSYLYRDAHNYKNQTSVVVEGEVQFSDIVPYLSEDKYFIPVQVGLEGLNGYDAETDHPWHEIDPDDFELTRAKPTIDLTAAELVANFKKAHQDGWDEDYFNSMLADRLLESATNIVRVPDTMNPSQAFTVRMQSDTHGSEDFPAASLQEAIDKILRLYNEAVALNDATERIIGMVVYPQDTQGDILTVSRSHTSQQSFRVQRQDFIWACDELGIGNPEALDGLTAETYVFNHSDNFDLLKIFLKQKELLR